MARIFDRQKAIDLRKKGMTYSEIRQKLTVSKSTLSDWLRKYPLTSEQIRLLENTRQRNRYLSIEKIILTKQKKYNARLVSLYEQEKKRLLTLNEKELELAGLFLYWGEGSKRMNGPLSINNTDPQVLQFALSWMEKSLKIPRGKIKVYLHLYEDMDIKQEILYWKKILDLPSSQFARPYIKKSTREKILHKGFGHGTCGLVVNNVRLKEKVMMGIKVVADFYSPVS